ncbi:MAG TPA: ABC transporter ATP-binding protein [Bacteroidales bacterium]|nr:ABC transporter ATP-binding protein [Bacteroidales bacterium]HOL98634.1 ABC transporter ATP-binding protein [Bacteroidales bacterium]HPD24096.1 ABC transporter ATP-binding protein [Bacteroidales bacterium]HRS99330.1 ABC transporter ATP-binding protein [Bacteroidales bacterium]HRT80025.1 ABC transporter ATP-binding protein [Bacteroidales bacterium]
MSKVFLKKEGLDRISFWQKIFKTNKSSNFFALKDINLEIKQGEIIGIIGPNGAGKSTLLKILAEVTPPSKGEVEIYGKLASILEIGIGFQPELSGYENIFLVGQLYGLRKKEIAKKIEKIIELFGFPNFINTEVKYYSSGMYMRLAFSIIINIEADIYLFDEILNVGDAAFQWQALAEIKKLKEKGKTVLIVTHVPKTIHNLCDRMLLLIKSEQISFDHPNDVIIEYQRIIQKQNKKLAYFLELEKHDILKFKSNPSFDTDILFFRISNKGFSNSDKIFYDKPIEILIKIKSNIKQKIIFALMISDFNGNLLNTQKISLGNESESTGEEITIIFKPFTFSNSQYGFEAAFLDENNHILCNYRNLLTIEFFHSENKTDNFTGIIRIDTEIIKKSHAADENL